MNLEHATIVIQRLCEATSITQRGPVVTITFPATIEAYAAYQAVSVALELDCDEVNP